MGYNIILMIPIKVKALCVLLLLVLALQQPVLGQTYTATNQRLSSTPFQFYPKAVNPTPEIAIGVSQEYSSGYLACFGRYYTDSSTSVNKNWVYCYDFDSVPKVQLDLQDSVLSFILLKQTMTMFLSNDNTKLTRYPITVVGTTYTKGTKVNYPDIPVVADQASYQAHADLVSTNFLWSLPVSVPVAGANSKNKLHRFDKTKATPTTADIVVSSAISEMNSLLDPVYFIYFYGNTNILMIFGQNDKFLMIDVTTPATPVVQVSIAAPVTTNRGPVTMYDPNNRDQAFASQVTLKVYRIQLTSTSAVLAASGSLTQTALKISGMKPVNALNAFIVSFKTVGSNLELVQNFDLVSQTITGTMAENMIGSLVTTAMVQNKLKLGMLYRPPTNPATTGGIQTYDITIDNCQTRGAVDRICTVCPTGYYLDTANQADNQCLAVGLHRGKDTVNGGTYYCEAGCDSCTDNYEICTKCIDPANGVLVKVSATSTRCLPDVPKGYGDPKAGTTPIIYERCIANCGDCKKDNKDYCYSCYKDFNRVFESNDKIRCQDTVVATDQLGLDATETENPLYRPCDPAIHCKTCLSNYKACSACDSNTVYTLRVQYSPTDIQCLDSATTAGTLGRYGRNAEAIPGTADLYYTACKDPNCSQCKDDYSICEICDGGFSRVKYSRDNDDISCIQTPTTPVDGFGLDSTPSPPVYKQCFDLNCVKCWDDYKICKECRCPTLLKVVVAGATVTTTCEATIPESSGFGLVPANDPAAADFVNAYRVCNNALCQKCLANYKVCTDCGAAYRIYHSATDIDCTNTAPVATDGIGRNKEADNGDADLYYTPCFDNCVSCLADVKVCKECTGNYVLAKADRDKPDVVCFDLNGQIYDGFGENTGSGTATTQYELCQDRACKKCWTDYSKCTDCDCDHFLVDDGTDVTCKATLVAGQGYGFAGDVTQNGENYIQLYQKCAAGCDQCLADIKKCTECTGSGKLHRQDNGDVTCFTQVQAGYGLVETQIYSDDYYEKCTTDNCLTCPNDNTRCETCDAANGFKLKFNSVDSLTCVQDASLTGYGFDSVNNYYVPCQDPRCDSCSADYKVCTVCKVDAADKNYLFANDGVTKCIKYSEIEAGYGINTAGNADTVEPCADVGCLNCYPNKADCLDCPAGEVEILAENGQKDCAPNAFVAAGGYTFDSANSIYVACRRDCATCDANGCLTCFSGAADNQRVRVGELIYCMPFADIPDGYSIDGNGIYVTCNDDCATCVPSSSNCATCSGTKKLWHKSNTEITCEEPRFIADGYGLRPDGEYDVCTVSGCAECHDDVAVCTECNGDLRLWIDGTTTTRCQPLASIPVAFGPNEKGVFVACPGTCVSCKDNLDICLSCQSPDVLVEESRFSTVCMPLANVPADFGLVDNLYRKCPEGCTRCRDNWYKCTACDAGLVLWAKSAGETVCESEPLIPDSFGPNTATPVVYVACSAHCEDCKSNLRKCSICELGYSLWVQTQSDTICEVPASIPDPFGPNEIGTYVKCDSAQCTQCRNSYKYCTACTGANFRLWIKSEDEAVCSLENGITGAYGKITPGDPNSVWAACAHEGCTACRDDINICTACNGGLSLWRQTASITVCEQEQLIPETFSKVNNIFIPCNSNCVSCKADINKCIRCASGFSLWEKDASTTSCDTVTNIAAAQGYGENVVGTYVKCSTHCKNCLADNEICTECDAAEYSLWRVTDTSTVCETPALITGSYGLSGNIYIPCDEKCLVCKANQAICDVCKSPYARLFEKGQTVGVCTVECDITDGYGKDDNSDYRACVDENCLQCRGNNNVCTVCAETFELSIQSAVEVICAPTTVPRPPVPPPACPVGCSTCTSQTICTACISNYYLWVKTENTLCFTKGQITDGFGIDLGVTNQIKKCEDAHCLKCKESIYICTDCDTGYSRAYQNAIRTTCVLNTDVQAGTGFNFITGQYEACFDGCLECKQNRNVCTNCDASRGLRRLLRSSTDVPCVLYVDIPIGFGIREDDDTAVIQCPSEICSGKICPSNGICNPDDNPGNRRIKTTTYDFRTATATIVFFNDTDRSYFVPESVMFIGYIDGSIDPDLTDIKYTWYYSENSGISYRLDTNGKDYQLSNLVVKSRARQARQTGASSAVHSQGTQQSEAERQELEIQFDDIEFSFGEVFLVPNLETTGGKKSASSQFSNALQYILKLIGFAFKVLLIPLDFFLAFTVDWVVATFSYLRLLDAPHVIRPSNVIHYLSSRTLFGFTISNPYKDWANAPECNVPMPIALHSLQCSLFYNYGHNLNILLAALVLSIAVYVITTLALWLINDPNDYINKWTRVVRYFFGFRYFFLFMHGVFLDLFGLILLNMTADNFSDSAVGAGLGLGIGILVFYLIFYVITAYSIHAKIELLKAGQPVALRPALSYFNFLSDPYRFDGRHPWLLYMALFWPIKSTIVIIIAIAARYKGLGQTIPIFSVEVVGLLILIALRAKKRLVDNAFDIVFQLLLCIYIGTEMVLSGKDEMANLQDSAVSVFMTVILYIMAIVAILYVLFRAFRAFARLNSDQPLPDILLPPVVEVQENSLLLDQSANWQVEWR